MDLEHNRRGGQASSSQHAGIITGKFDDERDDREHGYEEGEDSEEEVDYGYDAEHEEQTFDDDILATGEMENVPFL